MTAKNQDVAQPVPNPDPAPMTEVAAEVVRDALDDLHEKVAERVARPLLGALAQRKAAITETAAVAGYKLAVDLAPGDTILIPLKLVKVAITEQGVEVTFEDDADGTPGKTMPLDDSAAVRMG